MHKTSQGIFRISAVYGLTSLVLRAASFFLLPLFTHLIPSGEFGIYSMYAAAAVIFSALFSGGLQSALTKFYIAEDDPLKKREIFSFIFTLTLFLALPGLTASLLWPRAIAVFISGSPLHEALVRQFGCIMALESISSLALQLLKTREEVKKVAALSVLSGVVNIAMTILLLVFFKAGIYALVYSQLSATGLTLAMLLFYTSKDFSSFRPGRYFTPVLLFVYPLVFSGLFATLSDFADRFILNSFMGADKVGMYSFTYRIGLIMNVFVISFRMAWSPRSLNDIKKSDAPLHFGRVHLKLLAVSLLIIVGTVLIYPYLFTSVSGTQFCKSTYLTSRTVLMFIMTGYFFTGLMSFYSVYPMSNGKTIHFLLSDGIACAVNIGLNYILIPVWRLEGAAAATMIGYAAGALYLYVAARDKIRIVYNRNLTLVLFALLIILPAVLSIWQSAVTDAAVIVSLVFAFLFFRKSITGSIPA